MWQGVPTDDLISFIFETLLNESAVKQIKECAPLLKGLLDASTDKRFTQFAVLKGVTELVTAPKYGEAMLKKTATILMALYAEAPPHSPDAAPKDPAGHSRLDATHTPTPCTPPNLRYEIDLLEEDVVVKWHALTPAPQDDAGKKVREAAAPFMKWLREAEEESSAESGGEEGALPYAS